MAGKIVPAISSSNALVAALQVFEAIKMLSKKFQLLKGITYTRMNTNQRLNSLNRANEEPNPNCQVCSDDSMHLYSLTFKSLAEVTLNELVDLILLKEIKLNKSAGFVVEFDSNIIYE